MSRRPLDVRRWRAADLDPRDAPLGIVARAAADSPMLEGDAFFLEVGEDDPRLLAARLPAPLPSVPLFLGPRRARPTPLVRFGRLFGVRPETVPRAARGAALLLAGYRDIGGAIDPATGLDLVWGVG